MTAAGAAPSGRPDLVRHLARFARALREHGVEVRLSDEVDAVAALALVDLADRGEVERAFLAALKIQPAARAAFAALLARLWWGEEAAPREPAATPPTPPLAAPGRAGAAPRPAARAASETGAGPRPEGGEPGWSPEALLRRKPFDQCSAEELRAMERLLLRLVRPLATRPSRRRVAARGRGAADLRRSLRRAVSTGGELLTLARRAPAIERPRLLVLVDTSGSMDPHLRFLLAFVLALRRAAPGSEVFAFNTRLVRLTPWLGRARAGEVERTLAALAAAVPDWSGGTRIGECLAAFVERHLDPLVDARTVVLVASDGLDRGEVAPLAAAMRRIRARARRVFWLNPLAGDPRYQPTARAMAAALPHVDRLLPANDLESLARLLPLLAA
jgi:uncharacterized protein with von Willebrand factor type A (vWA) domain